jgi:type II secretory pathway pseudopilin PulG
MIRNSKTAKQQQGFTIMQMVVTITIVAIVSTVGVLGIKTARAEFQLHNSARLFASYVEKARADSVRRHAGTGAESSVETFGAGTSHYAVTMDFGSGVPETRTFQLESGTVFMTAAQKVTFDWRGRLLVLCDITRTCVYQVHSTYLERSVPVDISGSGDITVGEQQFPDLKIPEVELSDVDPDPSPSSSPSVEESPSPDEVDETPSPSPSPTPTPHGNGDGGDNGPGNGGDGPGNPNEDPSPTPPPTPVDGNPNATPTPTPTPTPVVPCVSSISPSTLKLSQTDTSKLSGTATFTMANATGVRLISASQEGHGNSLNIALSLVRIDGSGSSIITISTKNGAGNRGVFIVEVSASPACGSTQQLTVTVSN